MPIARVIIYPIFLQRRIVLSKESLKFAQAVYKSFVCLTLVGVSEDEFLTAAFKNWKNATGIEGKLAKHAKSRCHTLSSERFVKAKSCAADPSNCVDVMLSEENRDYWHRLNDRSKRTESQLQ
jgi:hypothetical protein